MTNLKTVKATIWIMVGQEKYSSAMNMGGVADELNDLVEERGMEVLEDVYLVNVLNEVSDLKRLGMSQDESSVNMGELDLSNVTYTYKLNSGEWSGKEFDDEDELKDFFIDKIKGGHMSEEEARCTDIVVEMYQDATFEDVSAEPGAIWFDEDGIKTEVDQRTYQCMGNTFVIEDDAHDALTELDREISGLKDDVENWKMNTGRIEGAVKTEFDRLASNGALPKVAKTLEEMTFEELADELANLNKIAQDIKRLMVKKSRDDL